MHHPIEPEDLAPLLGRAADWLRHARRVAVLTGAGVTAESGVSTFRDNGGLWEKHRVEDVATPSAFRRDPALVWRFYNARRANLRAVKPNPGHFALAELERHLGPGRFTLITQNVDRLHQAAGSRNVLELHGDLLRVRCTGCGRVEDRGLGPLDDLPCCAECGELLRPNVVWFEEPLPPGVWEAAEAATAASDAFLVVGTSAVVYPAAGLIDTARAAGARVIEANVERTPASQLAHVGLYGRSGEVLPQLVRRVVAGEPPA